MCLNSARIGRIMDRSTDHWLAELAHCLCGCFHTEVSCTTALFEFDSQAYEWSLKHLGGICDVIVIMVGYDDQVRQVVEIGRAHV